MATRKLSYQELEDEVERLRKGIAELIKVTPPCFSNLSPITVVAMSSTQIHSHVKELLVEPEPEPYCTECGSEKLAYVDQCASGDSWKCDECGNEFIW